MAAFAQAYTLGEKESAAAVNLLQHVPPHIKEAMAVLVRSLGMIISEHIFNECFNVPHITLNIDLLRLLLHSGSQDLHDAQILQS